jgi:cytosine/adenosine deaminase-related metal-dependent hydrolase
MDSFSPKQSSKLHFHNFIELFGLLPDDAEFRLDNAKNILNIASKSNKSNSLTPHATYSISNKLWDLISKELKRSNSIVSIHYGESQQEYNFLKDQSGALAENFKVLGIANGIEFRTSPLEIVKTYLPKQNPTLFIHNTFAQRAEIEAIKSHFEKPYVVLCPSSNLFIEGRIPDVLMIKGTGACIALGTDSYASSNTLSVFDQAKILLEKIPGLNFNEVIQWATLNGAKALGVEHIYGSFEKGKKPGLNLITNFDFNQMKPTSQSRVKRLI